jgi:hypothetical protein
MDADARRRCRRLSEAARFVPAAADTALRVVYLDN